MRLDHLLSKEFLFWNGKEDRLRIRLKIFGSVFFGKEGRGFLGLGMLSGFWSSAPDLTPPLRMVTVFVVVCLVWVCWL